MSIQPAHPNVQCIMNAPYCYVYKRKNIKTKEIAQTSSDVVVDGKIVLTTIHKSCNSTAGLLYRTFSNV